MMASFARRRSAAAGAAAFARRLSTTAAAPAGSPSFRTSSLLVGSGAVAGVVLQTYWGTCDNFFEYKFITTANPDDIIELYQGEDLFPFISLSVIGVPYVTDFILGGTNFRTESNEGWDSTVDTKVLGGMYTMETNFVLTEEEETLEDGDTVVGYFNRHERFTNFFPFTAFLTEWGIPRLLIWDTTWNFGYKRLNNGTCEVFHQGERFYGPFPVRILMHLHWSLVTRLLEKHVTSEAFSTQDDDEVQQQLANIPVHLLKKYIGTLRKSVERVKAEEEAKGGKSTMHPAALEQLAKYEQTISALKALEKKQPQAKVLTSTSIKRRPSALAEGEDAAVRRQTLQMQIADQAARQTIQEAIGHIVDNSDGNDGHAAVSSSLSALAASPELQFKEKPKRSITRRGSVRGATPPASPSA